jgi:hypothetical protein
MPKKRAFTWNRGYESYKLSLEMYVNFHDLLQQQGVKVSPKTRTIYESLKPEIPMNSSHGIIKGVLSLGGSEATYELKKYPDDNGTLDVYLNEQWTAEILDKWDAGLAAAFPQPIVPQDSTPPVIKTPFVRMAEYLFVAGCLSIILLFGVACFFAATGVWYWTFGN